MGQAEGEEGGPASPCLRDTCELPPAAARTVVPEERCRQCQAAGQGLPVTCITDWEAQTAQLDGFQQKRHSQPLNG